VVIKPHPLAAANPDKSVVVWEAGCRTRNDEIVYIAAVGRPCCRLLQAVNSSRVRRTAAHRIPPRKGLKRAIFRASLGVMSGHSAERCPRRAAPSGASRLRARQPLNAGLPSQRPRRRVEHYRDGSYRVDD
jgi:hypothetical protein